MKVDHTSASLPPPVRGSVAITPQDPDTLLPVNGHGDAAARFVLPVPTDLPTRPVRVYASLTSAPTAEARVDLAVAELERQGAFSRSNILVATPTGGGHINPVAVELVERMARGDVASVGVQYGRMPSFMSIHKVDDARDAVDMLLHRIQDRISQLHPNGGGPRVLLYGESLGAWASQWALDRAAGRLGGGLIRRGGDPLAARGVARAAWVGVPGFSRFDVSRLGPGGVQAVNAVSELDKLSPQQRHGARVWMLNHLDDPVHRADLALIWKRPKWLPKDGPNPERIDPDQRWRPGLTFVRTLADVVRDRGTAKPGEFGDHGHDYRAELPRLLRDAYAFGRVSDAELERITEQVRRSELWIMNQKWQ